jgi:hypothetical protein
VSLKDRSVVANSALTGGVPLAISREWDHAHFSPAELKKTATAVLEFLLNRAIISSIATVQPSPPKLTPTNQIHQAPSSRAATGSTRTEQAAFLCSP